MRADLADVEALPWGVVKGLLLRHLRWWARQPVFTDSGLLSIGYAYPNLIMAEGYNSPGSPCWALKAFLPLALPADHPFWTAVESPLPELPPIKVQSCPEMINCRDAEHDHVFVLSGRQHARWVRHGAEKYARFAYSASFGFSVSSGARGLNQGAHDSTLALSEDGEHFGVRQQPSEFRVEGEYVYSQWKPASGVNIETWLVPCVPWHVRIHRLCTDRTLHSAERGFALDCTGLGIRRVGAGTSLAAYPAGWGGLRDLPVGQEATRVGFIVQAEPNTNLLHPRTVIPTLLGTHKPGEHWLCCAVVGVPALMNFDAVWEHPPAVDFRDGTLSVTAPAAREISRIVVEPQLTTLGQKQTILIAATFTAEPLADCLAFWARELRMPWAVEFAPFNQVFQQLLDSTSRFAKNRDGINIALVRFEDWQGAEGKGTEVIGRASERPAGDLPENLHELVLALEASIGRCPAPHLVVVCPASPEALADPCRARLFRELGDRLVAELSAVRGVCVVIATELAGLYPVERYYDPSGEKLGHVPYTPEFFAAIGTMIARKISALRSTRYKVIALDCDSTLWAGVCGEDGPAGVEIDAPHRALQEFMLAQQQAGKLLCLCSKNNEEDVAAVFEHHRDTPLRREHIARSRLNWQPKSANLRSLAEELRLGLDSFILVDNDPIECAEVQANCPEVLTVQLPPDATDIPRFLKHHWAFDLGEATDEDRQRSVRYRQDTEREHWRDQSLTLRDFLAGLALDVRFAGLEPRYLDRVAQLTQRTNQFNVTSIRRTGSELQELCGSGRLEGLITEVSDRFGDYGLVGVLLFRSESELLEVDTFLLSCRALGRGVEHRMLARLGEIAQQRGRVRVDVPYCPTRRNQPSLDFLQSVGSHFQQPRGDGFLFRFPAGHAAHCAFNPPDRSPLSPHQIVADGRATERPAVVVPAPSPLLRRIATELFDPARVLGVIAARNQRGRPDLDVPCVPPRSPLEQELAAIWRRVLSIDSVGIHDNFFALGGQSLFATQLISRIRDRFQTELSIRAIFEAPTVAGLAAALIDANRPAGQDLDTVPQELDMLEALSDEEARLLLEGASRATKPLRIPRPSVARSGRVQSATPTRIGSVGIITRDRLHTLERALTSYMENCREHGRTTPFMVLDDSRDAGVRQHCRRMLELLARRFGVGVTYAGREERLRFADRLIETCDVPADVVQFALFDVAPHRMTAGANRNALLLATVGDLVLTIDDDTVCRPAPAPDVRRGLKLSSGADPTEYWFFADREEALRSVASCSQDILAGHEQFLGKDPAGILAAEAERECSRAEPDFANRLTRVGGRVAVTFNGLLGDCGWGAPFGNWDVPLGYLFLGAESHQRLVDSEARYRSARTSREILRVVDRPTVSDHCSSLLPFAGLDNRSLLPPFLPVERGQDLIFGATLGLCFPDSCTVHLPWVLLHAPVPPRRFWPGEIVRTASGIDLCRLMIECIRSCGGAAGADDAARMRALGRQLIELGSAPLPDFEAHVRARLEQSSGQLIDMLEGRVQAADASPDYWARDVQRYVEILRRSLCRDDYCVPLDLIDGRSLADARELARRVVRQFGELLHWWPAMVEAARTLRQSGEHLTRRPDDTG